MSTLAPELTDTDVEREMVRLIELYYEDENAQGCECDHIDKDNQECSGTPVATFTVWCLQTTRKGCQKQLEYWNRCHSNPLFSCVHCGIATTECWQIGPLT